MINALRTWFYFAVKGVERGKFVHFHIKNLNFQRSLYAAGLKPFYRIGNEGRFKRVLGKLTWNVSKYYSKPYFRTDPKACRSTLITSLPQKQMKTPSHTSAS